MGAIDLTALAGAALLTVVMAITEALLFGESLTRWLASLKRPKLYAPMPLWIVVGIATYVLQGLIAYRLLADLTAVADWIALGALFAVMAANVAYNVVLANRRDPRVAYTGLFYFLAPLAALQVALFIADPLSARFHLIYVAWVIGYDLPIMRSLWKLNRSR